MAIFAQAISVVASVVVGMIVPKFIDEYQYAYWQTFILYFGYIGLIPLGILDGLILRYSQYDYQNLNKSKIAAQFRILFVWTVFVACVIACASIFVSNITAKQVMLLLALACVIHIFYAYNYDLFQITNRINYYAIAIVIQRLIYVGLIVLLLILKVNNFGWFCIAELIGEIVVSLVFLRKNAGLFFTKGEIFRDAIKETTINISSGLLLTISNFSAGFLISGAKMVIQWRWDELVFGKVSFAFSLTNVFLTFITAISVVLFPSLKRMKEEELPNLYGNIRGAISPILVAALILYFPLVKILNLWLPKYSQSLVYLGILLPIIIYSSKVSLLTNNYLKAYRKEKLMLIINVACVAVGFLMAFVSAYVINDLNILLYSVVLIIMARSIISEIAVMKVIAKKRYFDFVAEFIMTVIFIVAVRYFSFWIGLAVYAVALVVYCIVYRRSIVGIFKKVFKRKKQSNLETSDI